MLGPAPNNRPTPLASSTRLLPTSMDHFFVKLLSDAEGGGSSITKALPPLFRYASVQSRSLGNGPDVGPAITSTDETAGTFPPVGEVTDVLRYVSLFCRSFAAPD